MVFLPKLPSRNIEGQYMISRSAATTYSTMSIFKGMGNTLHSIFNEYNRRVRQRSDRCLPIQLLLQLVANNSVDEAKEMIDQKPRRLLEADDVVTANNWHIECVTPLELALCCGSPEMVEMMESYFGLFDGGIEELKAIYTKYHQQIRGMLSITEHTDSISSLGKVISSSNNQQLIAALNEDMSEDNPLNNVLNAHMQHAKRARRVDAKLFFPYQYLLQAFDFYDSFDNDCKDKDMRRRCVFSMRVIGPLIYQLPYDDQRKVTDIIKPEHKTRVNQHHFYYLKRVDSFGELTAPAKISLMDYVIDKQRKLLAITNPERHIEFQVREVQTNEKKMLPADLRSGWGRLR
jgi:hypothetical protein